MMRLALLWALGSWTLASAEEPVRYQVRETLDVKYGSAPVRAPKPGDKDLLLDVYEPIGAPGKRPAFVAIHGGGFASGDKREKNLNTPMMCRDLASRGYVAVSINYRLSKDDPPGESTSPGQRAIAAALADCANAVRWLANHAQAYQVDPHAIAVGGQSAGAMAALALGYGPEGHGLPIKAVVNQWGRVLGSLEDITKDGPPLLTMHGTDDPTVPFSNAEAIAARAKKVGLDHTYYVLPGVKHGIRLDAKVDGQTWLDRVADFLDRHLR